MLAIFFEVFSVWMCVTGVQKVLFYWNSRFCAARAAHVWGNILFPAMSLLWPVLWAFRPEEGRVHGTFSGLLFSAFLNTIGRSQRAGAEQPLSSGPGRWGRQSVPALCPGGSDLLNLHSALSRQQLSRGVEGGGAGAPLSREKNLFFFGQIISKLSTTSKTMSLTCVTLVLAIFLFIAAPVLVGWASGYLDERSMYDVQIFSRYNDVCMRRRTCPTTTMT